MGTLHYGMNNCHFDFEDRLLQHLKLVIGNKLKRGESFMFNWQNTETGLHSTLWLHPSIPLHFTFDRVDQGELNKEWAETLSFLANSPSGLTIVSEPAVAEVG